MPVSFPCPHCARRLTVGDKAAGRSAPCPGCGGKVTVPVEPASEDVAVELVARRRVPVWLIAVAVTWTLLLAIPVITSTLSWSLSPSEEKIFAAYDAYHKDRWLWRRGTVAFPTISDEEADAARLRAAAAEIKYAKFWTERGLQMRPFQ